MAKKPAATAPVATSTVISSEFISKDDPRFNEQEGLLVNATVTAGEGPSFCCWSGPVFLEGLADGAPAPDVHSALLAKYGVVE